jgi:SagB-type dehydrogenase family enzyme
MHSKNDRLDKARREHVDAADALRVVLAYHERTKHRAERYARSLGYMDWASQPDPFRRFDGAAVVELPLTDTRDGPRYGELTAGRLPDPQPLEPTVLARVLRDSLGLSAWKQSGASRWALRLNPSSGNLHPTEAYVVVGPRADSSVAGGVYHYAPEIHALERRRTVAIEMWKELAAQLPDGSFLVALTSIHWREAWKYGERSFRYCQHDAGHAIAALSYAAASVGYRLTLLPGATDDDVEVLVGAHQQDGIEAEAGICLLAAYPASKAFPLEQRQRYLVAPALRETWLAEPADGTPNRLSRDHHPWRVIDEVAAACRRVRPPNPMVWSDTESVRADLPPSGDETFRAIAHRRRSAVAMDGETHIDRATFLRIVSAALVRQAPPFDALPWAPRIDLALFVHRVHGIEPGLYAVVRDPSRLERLQGALDASFVWRKIETEMDLPLYLLQAGDCRQLAGAISCEQYSIASEGVLAAAMLADYTEPLDIHGAWFYRALYWEAGLLGQALYLEAEAAGIRATGIGCYFDDATHDLLGLQDRRFQVLYHFTLGGPVDDGRLQTLPPYAHLTR